MSSQNSQENPAIYETQPCGTKSERQNDNNLVHLNRRRVIPFVTQISAGDSDSGEHREYDSYNADALDRLGASFNISNYRSIPSGYAGDDVNESETLEPGAATSQLHELCAKLGPGYTPLFQFDPVRPSGFSALLVINREEFVARGPYKSKKEAKFEVAKMGLSYVTALQEDMQQDGGPCWMKYLNELCGLQQWTMDRPEYIVNVPNTFACIIRVNGHPYGDMSASYKSKRIARNEAARLALEALCTDSTINNSGQSQGKQEKHKQVEDELVKEIGIAGIPIDRHREVPTISVINDLCDSLRIPRPQFRYVEVVDMPAWYDVEAMVNNQLFRLSNIFGKKNARERITEKLYNYLMEIKPDRQKELENLKGLFRS
ncbi:hypothetical protein V1506DRAFT_535893 [Lipomyces tetrasporus]